MLFWEKKLVVGINLKILGEGGKPFGTGKLSLYSPRLSKMAFFFWDLQRGKGGLFFSHKWFHYRKEKTFIPKKKGAFKISMGKKLGFIGFWRWGRFFQIGPKWGPPKRGKKKRRGPVFQLGGTGKLGR